MLVHAQYAPRYDETPSLQVAAKLMHCSIAAVRKLALQAVTADADACQISFVQAVMGAGAEAMCKAMGTCAGPLSRFPPAGPVCEHP